MGEGEFLESYTLNRASFEKCKMCIQHILMTLCHLAASWSNEAKPALWFRERLWWRRPLAAHRQTILLRLQLPQEEPSSLHHGKQLGSLCNCVVFFAQYTDQFLLFSIENSARNKSWFWGCNVVVVASFMLVDHLLLNQVLLKTSASGTFGRKLYPVFAKCNQGRVKAHCHLGSRQLVD